MSQIPSDIINLINWLSNHMGPDHDIEYSSWSDKFYILHKVRVLQQEQVFISKKQVLTMMTGDSDDEAAMLMHYFWGVAPIADKPPKRDLEREEFRSSEGCSHDWHLVTLFNAPQERCKWCDIKKGSV